MRWLSGVVAILLVLEGLVIGAYRVGARLPAEHDAVVSGVVPASQDRVWQMITETVSQAGWRTGVAVTQNADAYNSKGGICWSEVRSIGGFQFCVVEQQPKAKRVVEIVRADYSQRHNRTDDAVQGRWVYELEPASGGTRVTIREAVTVKPPLMRFYGQYVLRERTQARQYLLDLQAEAGREK